MCIAPLLLVAATWASAAVNLPLVAVFLHASRSGSTAIRICAATALFALALIFEVDAHRLRTCEAHRAACQLQQAPSCTEPEVIMKRKIVAITGASAGVGRATAIAFARRGWHVALLARGTDGLDGARRDVEEAGGVALVLPTDVADHQQVEAAADHVEQEWGPIAVWINNAMATIFCDFLHISPEDFKRSTEVTYLGAVYGTLAALKRMHPRNKGMIVQVGSALAYRSIPLQSPYCGAKSALRGFTDSLRSELIHDRSNVHITMVHLSAFNTPQFEWGRTCMTGRPRPMGKIFQPEVAAEAIYHASQHRRRELWVGFPAVQAILGQRVIPGTLDRYLAHTAVDGQHTDEPVPPGRRDNLYEPVPGDHGAHGRFDAQATTSSPQLWANTHRWLIAGAGLALIYLAKRARTLTA